MKSGKGRQRVMQLRHARLCHECETLFTRGDKCPACSNRLWFNLSTLVPSSDVRDLHEPDHAPPVFRKGDSLKDYMEKVLRRAVGPRMFQWLEREVLKRDRARCRAS